MGSRPAKSATKSKSRRSTAVSRCSTASSRMPPSSSATRRGVKTLETSERIRVWSRRVHGEERHGPVGVGSVGGGIEGDAEPVRQLGGVRGRRRGRHRGARAPRSRARRCGRAAPRPADGHRSGRGPRASGSRTGCSAAEPPVVRRHRTPSRSGPGHVGEGVGDTPVRQVPHPGPQHRTGVGQIEAEQDGGIGVGAERRGDPGVQLGAEPHSQSPHVGPAAEQGGGARRRQFRIVGHEQTKILERAGQSIGNALTPGRSGDGRQRIEPPPQDLGQQVVLGGEVGVGGGRGHAGSPRHAAHGEPLVSTLTRLVGGGVDQRCTTPACLIVSRRRVVSAASAAPVAAPSDSASSDSGPSKSSRSICARRVMVGRPARGCGASRRAWPGTGRWPRSCRR